jgi:Y_Y_Y domain
MYSYKLAGFDKDWSVLSKQRHVFYTYLLPSTYEFKIKYSNSASLLGNNITSVTLIIKAVIVKSFLCDIVQTNARLFGLH